MGQFVGGLQWWLSDRLAMNVSDTNFGEHTQIRSFLKQWFSFNSLSFSQSMIGVSSLRGGSITMNARPSAHWALFAGPRFAIPLKNVRLHGAFVLGRLTAQPWS